MPSALLSELMQVFPIQIPAAAQGKPGSISTEFISGEKTLNMTSALWGGTTIWTPPAGTPQTACIINQLGHIVMVNFLVVYPTAGTLNNMFEVGLPDDAPAPWVSSIQPANVWCYPPTGGVIANLASALDKQGACGIYKNASNKFMMKIVQGVTVSANFAMGSLQYVTAS